MLRSYSTQERIPQPLSHLTDFASSISFACSLLHWAIAALVLLAAPMGVYMVALPFRQLWLKFLLYQPHKTIGITAFVLALG
jgi:cytochrome b561